MRVPTTASRLCSEKRRSRERVPILLTHTNVDRDVYFMPSGNCYGLSIAAIALTKDGGITGKGECRCGDAALSVNAAGYPATACRISTDRAVEGAMVKTVGTAMLSHFLGKNILQICHNQYNPKSNCAHFIGHALGIKVGDTNCYNVAPEGIPKPGFGFTIRVDDLFNHWCPDKGLWSKPAAIQDCLFFISIPSNVSKPPLWMGKDDTKHVGIYEGGAVWHYSNSMRKVVTMTVAQMHNHYPGLKPDTWLFYGTFGS